jgi:hypothetical protein
MLGVAGGTMRLKKLVLVVVSVLALVPMFAVGLAGAQEIPQPISRPCKHPCLNKIRFVPGPRLDLLELHARIIPVGGIDPASEAFTVELTDNGGNVIFTASLAPGDFKVTGGGKKFTYRNPAAKTAGGLFRVQIAERKDASEGYRVDVLAFGDLSLATAPDITTFIAVGDDGFFDNSTWKQRSYGWSVDFPV